MRDTQKYLGAININRNQKRDEKRKRYMLSKEDVLKNPSDTVTHENDVEVSETYCAYFGCGERLSLIENLCGDFCSEHKNLKPFIYHNGLL